MTKPDQPLNATMGDIFLKELAPKESRFPPEKLRLYQQDPVAYAEEVLRIKTLTEVQKEILLALVQPPYRVMVKSGHSVGKTHISAVAVNWSYDCFDPGVTITTAPTERDVVDLLWAEVRVQRQRAGLPDDFRGSTGPDMRTSHEHYAKGFTARTGTSFQGRHPKHLVFAFDEAGGVLAQFWTTTDTMFKPEPGHAWLAILNPTDDTCRAYQEEHLGEWVGPSGAKCRETDPGAEWSPKWRVFTMSCLDHPNITGNGPQIDAAVSIAQVDGWVRDWTEEIPAGDEVLATDIEWPIGSGIFRRPGPEFQSRVLGVWPSEDSSSVWSDSLWVACTRPLIAANFSPDHLPEVGGDLSSGGSNMTALHGRWGAYSLQHEEHQGWSANRKMGKIVEMCRELAEYYDRICSQLKPDYSPLNPRLIRIKLDDAAGGWDMVTMLRDEGYNATPINSAQIEGVDLQKYPKMRSQLWFQTAFKAMHGLVHLGLLPRRTVEKLKLEAKAPKWSMDRAGRRCVEEKDETIKRIGHSPDGMDAVNLAYLQSDWRAPQAIVVARAPLYPRTQERGRDERVENSPVRNVRRSRDLFGRRFQ